MDQEPESDETKIGLGGPGNLLILDVLPECTAIVWKMLSGVELKPVSVTGRGAPSKARTLAIACVKDRHAYPRVFLKKWIVSLNFRCMYFASIQKEDDRKRLKACSIEDTFAAHELTHHGETPHTLRHWIRGGNVRLVRSHDAAARGDPAAIQWIAMCTELKSSSSESERPIFAPGLLGGNVGTHAIKHTDLHLIQIAEDPAEFARQVLTEAAFPETVQRTTAYAAMRLSVQALCKGLNNVGAVMWVRNVTGAGAKNRELEPFELEGCLLATKRVASKLNRPHVIVIGDPGGLDWMKRKDPFVTALLGTHMQLAGQSLTQLEQLQFLTALFEVTGARVVLGERTGAVDRVALCTGAASCQFLGRNIHGNTRLEQVYASGFTMGCMVDLTPARNAQTVCDAMVAATEAAIAERDELAEWLASM